LVWCGSKRGCRRTEVGQAARWCCGGMVRMEAAAWGPEGAEHKQVIVFDFDQFDCIE